MRARNLTAAWLVLLVWGSCRSRRAATSVSSGKGVVMGLHGSFAGEAVGKGEEKRAGKKEI